MDLELLQFIDANVLEKPARVVRSAKPVCDPPAMDRIEKLRFRLSGALNALQQGGISDAQASVNEHILSMLKYKYSNPNKHMKFWTNLKKLHAQVKKLDAGGLKQSIRRLEDAVSVGSMYYTPTPEYLTYIGCLLLNRLYRLDRIRITAAKMAFVSMGYIDIGNWMTLNLLLVAVASDIAKDCLGQMIELSLIYNELASNLREGSERLPENVGVLRFESVKGGLIKNALSIEQPDANLLGTITYVLEISDEELVANYKSRLQEAARYDRASLIKSLNIAPEEGASGKAVEDDDEISTIGAEEENGDSAEEPDNENTVTVPKKKKKPKAKLVKALKKVIAKKKLKKKAKKEA